ncbi:MAG: flagellar basal body L-ring protein FlgH [Acidobacteriota bacterium]|nr:flagellar basal body L-ring protein FlgH [Acidobacteriota bacterium]
MTAALFVRKLQPWAMLFALSCLVLPAAQIPGLKKKSSAKPQEPSGLDRYISEASSEIDREAAETAPGAIWSPASRLNDLGRDLRASQINDVVTILVSENVNAVAGGASTTERASSAQSNVTSLAGKTSAAGALANLAGLTGDQKLNGTGTTSRTATLTATLTARVVRVLPGGLLLIEGDKHIQINSEDQLIVVRGIIRTPDISTTNTVASSQVADMEVRVNGKGVVEDAIRRPNFLYRLVLGLLPF